MSNRSLGLVATILLLTVGGCSKKPTEGGVRLKQVNDAFVSAGLKLDTFHDVDPGRFSAQKCAGGTLEGVDTVVCEYGSADAVTRGKKAGEDWLGQAPTGSVLTNGNTVLALADRSRTDPNGKAINRITHAYRQIR
jgi:hypothetical protein